MRRPTKIQMKAVCVIGLRLATGDYLGVAQDLSINKISFQKILRGSEN